MRRVNEDPRIRHIGVPTEGHETKHYLGDSRSAMRSQ